MWKSDSHRDSACRLGRVLAKTVQTDGMAVTEIMRLYIEGIRASMIKPASFNTVFHAIRVATNQETKQFDTDKFFSELSTENPSTDTARDEYEWKYYFAANFVVARRSNRWRSTWGGVLFELNSTSAARSNYIALLGRAPYDIQHRIRDKSQPTRWPGYFVFCSTGHNALHAFGKIQQQFHLLRGALELVTGGGTMSHSTPARLPRKIEMESWAIAERSDGEVDYVGFNWLRSSFSDFLQVPNPTKIETKHIRAATRLKIRCSNQASSSIKAVLTTAIEQYADAMDQLLPNDQFLHFWQLAETATLASAQGGNTEVVAKRFGDHIRYRGVTDYDAYLILKHLGSLRNSMVHKGEHDGIDDQLVNEFKIACSRAIWWLCGRTQDFKTINNLDWWYRHRSLPDRRLEDIAKMSQITLDDRSK